MLIIELIQNNEVVLRHSTIRDLDKVKLKAKLDSLGKSITHSVTTRGEDTLITLTSEDLTPDELIEVLTPKRTAAELLADEQAEELTRQQQFDEKLRAGLIRLGFTIPE